MGNLGVKFKVMVKLNGNAKRVADFYSNRNRSNFNSNRDSRNANDYRKITLSRAK